MSQGRRCRANVRAVAKLPRSVASRSNVAKLCRGLDHPDGEVENWREIGPDFDVIAPLSARLCRTPMPAQKSETASLVGAPRERRNALIWHLNC